jgi:hypothetical protein
VRVEATAFALRDHSTPPANPRSRRLKFKASTKAGPPPNEVIPPARGSAGDPTANGAILRVYNSAGSAELMTVVLPPSGWTVRGGFTTPRGFRFRATDASAPVQRVDVQRDRIRIAARGAGWTYTLDEASQGSIALRLTLGSGATWCAEAGRAPYPARVDTVDRFIGASDTPPPAVCPALP